MTCIEQAAHALAAAMGYDFDAAFDDKAAWIKAHGDNGSGFVDVNEPFKCDFVDGARAVLLSIKDTPMKEAAGIRETYGSYSRVLFANRVFNAAIDMIVEPQP